MDAAVRVADCVVRYRRLGTPGAPGVLFVHGGRAHGGWWTAVAPLFADRYDVLVPDLSGHGDSDHRHEYTPRLWAEELAAVVTHAGTSRVAVVGHSMGGKVAVFLAVHRPDLVNRVVLVDTPLRPPGVLHRPPGELRHPKKRYADKETALARFRLTPPETTADPALLRAVAEAGLTELDGGWAWKFDPQAARRITDEAVHAELRRLHRPVGAVDGLLSPLAGPATTAYLAERLGRPVPRATVPDAYHHVPLDAPTRCAAAIDTILADLVARAGRGGTLTTATIDPVDGLPPVTP